LCDEAGTDVLDLLEPTDLVSNPADSGRRSI
jgi:hypothetical protein